MPSRHALRRSRAALPALVSALLAVALLCAATTGRSAEPPAKLDRILQSVVRVMATVPADARTARALGRARAGNGVVIDGDGLVLTIGYLILEADRVMVAKAGGDAPIPAKVLAYDYDTGFGLIRAREKLGVRPVTFGDSRKIKRGDTLVIAGYGGRAQVRPVAVVSRRDFAGYWEYLLEGALFTAPIYRQFGGAALLDLNGRLVGIGSLAVPDAGGRGRPPPGNMFVPIEKLKPVLADMLAHGRSRASNRPWIGAFTRQIGRGRVIVVQVAQGGPAAKAGLQQGDFILAVNGAKIAGQIDFYRKLWAVGQPGAKAQLEIRQGTATRTITVVTGDRYKWLKLSRD